MQTVDKKTALYENQHVLYLLARGMDVTEFDIDGEDLIVRRSNLSIEYFKDNPDATADRTVSGYKFFRLRNGMRKPPADDLPSYISFDMPLADDKIAGDITVSELTGREFKELTHGEAVKRAGNRRVFPWATRKAEILIPQRDLVAARDPVGLLRYTLSSLFNKLFNHFFDGRDKLLLVITQEDDKMAQALRMSLTMTVVEASFLEILMQYRTEALQGGYRLDGDRWPSDFNDDDEEVEL